MSHGFCPGRSLPADWITHGPILQVTWSLFAPLALAMMASSTVGITDMYVAGFLGSRAQAAVGIGDQLLFFVLVFGTGLSIAASSLIAQSAGALNNAACKTYAIASLILGAAAGILSSLAGVLCADPLLNLFTSDQELHRLAVPYTINNAPANLPFIISLVCSGIFRALGKASLSSNLWMITALAANLISLFLFFSGIDSMHSLFSLAIGWCAGAFVGAAYALFSCWTLYIESEKLEGPDPRGANSGRGDHDNVAEKKYCFARINESAHESGTAANHSGLFNKNELVTALNQLIALGLPAVFAELALVLSHFGFYKVLALCSHSAEMQAAWTIKLKLEEVLVIIPLMALGLSTSVIVAQCIGAGLFDRAKLVFRSIAISAIVAALLAGFMLSAAAPGMAAFFSLDSITQSATQTLLAPSCLLLPLLALSCISCSAMEGAGQTKIPMALNLLLQLATRLALAYYFAIEMEMQLDGVLLGILVSQMLMSVLSAAYCAVRLPMAKTQSQPQYQNGMT